MRITLTVTDGPHVGQVYSFEEHDNFIVGRSKRAHFRLPVKDKYFSRIHFMIEVNPPQCRLMDMGSTNGTYVNEERVDVADLKDGDQIKAGRTVLQLSVEGTPSVPPEVVPVETTPMPQVRPTIQPDTAPTPRPPDLGRPGHCRACDAALEGTAAPDPSLPLCASCYEKSLKHAQAIAGYRIIMERGRGGMGVVYQAVRQADGLLVALKTIIPAVAASKAHVERFLREADILKQLDHPNIVAFRDMGSSNGQLFFAMDYVRGTDGAGLLKKNGGPLAIPRAVRLVVQLLNALDFAHTRKFVHRDIKPANVLVKESDGEEIVQLADFGLARVYQASQLSGLTMMGDLGGTVAFMPPEQITHYREAKPPVDQYAAAATLYNLLTARFIYDMPRNVQQQLLLVLQEQPVPIQQRRPEIPGGLAKIIHRALAREAADRYPDVRTMRNLLLPYLAG